MEEDVRNAFVLFLHFLGKEFKDTGINFQEFMARKPKLPLGQVPVLFVTHADGSVTEIPESLSILKHLGRIGNIYGATEREHVRADYILESIGSIKERKVCGFDAFAGPPHFNKVAEKRDAFYNNDMPNLLNMIQKFLNETKTGLLVGPTVTHTDIFVYDLLDCLLDYRPECLNGHADIIAFHHKLANLDKIKAYSNSAARRPRDYTPQAADDKKVEVKSRELTYFGIRGRGESIRVVMHHLGMEFKDNGIMGQDFPALKPKLPLGQLPLLTETYSDGSTFEIPESLTILKHLARVGNIYGADEKERVRADYILEALANFNERKVAEQFAGFPNFNKDAAKRDAFYNNDLGTMVNMYKKFLDETKSGFLVGQSVTHTDIYGYNALDAIQNFRPGCLDGHQELIAFHQKVANLPNIKAYLNSDKRRKPDFTPE